MITLLVRGKGCKPRVYSIRQIISAVRERPKIIEKTVSTLSMSRALILTKGMDICTLFFGGYKCSESCPQFRECGSLLEEE